MLMSLASLQITPSLPFILSVPYRRRTGLAKVISNYGMDMDIYINVYIYMDTNHSKVATATSNVNK